MLQIFKKGIKLIKKIVIMFVCLIFLLFQTYELLARYLEKNTVNSIEMVIGEKIFPAFTVCYNKYRSFERMVKYFPEFQTDFKKYMNVSRYVTRLAAKDLNKDYSNNDYYINLYNKIDREFTKNILVIIKQVFYNISKL